MQDYDPGNLPHGAGALLLDRAPAGTIFTVVDFDSTATVVVARSQDRDAARQAVRRADAAGGTDIAAALAAGYQELAFVGGNALLCCSPRGARTAAKGGAVCRGGYAGARGGVGT